MDVRCSRCATEYEFDDALISERGTTVKCTNCGYQFKIFPPKAATVAPERWLVRVADGREVVYTSLRELQRGIAERQVGPNDSLSRGNAPPRPLGSIPELEPFFAASSSRAVHRAARTLHGVAPPQTSSPGQAVPAPDPRRPGGSPITTMMGSGVGMAPMPPVAQQPPARAESAPASVPAPVTTPHFTPKAPDPSVLLQPLVTSEPAPRSQPKAAPFEPPAPSSPMSASPPSVRRMPSQDFPVHEPVPASARMRRESYASYDELPAEGLPDAGRRARSRWIAAIVLLGLLGLFAVTIGRQYLERYTARRSAPVPAAPDERVSRSLAESNRLLEEGDFEGAKEQLVKAQTLSDKNPQVLSSLARLETMRADLYWLRLRLLDPQSTELVQSTHRELGRRVGKARQAVDAAFATDPESATVVRARVDVMRLSGESDKAREWLAPIAAKADDPENAYVLAALGLAEATPPWPTVIERLRVAGASSKESVRARAALIYALAQSGALDDAQAEFSKLESEERAHPLLDELRSFVQRMKGASDAGASDAAAKPVPTVDVSKLGKLDTTESPEPRGETTGDFRQRLVQAATAVRSGDLPRAEQLYQSVLNEQPNNTEALSGLADVAKRRNDHATAGRLYQRVLEQNPSYVPALMASADSKWASGDKKGALTLYRRVLEQAGAGSEYGARAAARIAEGSKEAQTEATPTATTEATAEPPEQPVIDTTDLPGMGQ